MSRDDPSPPPELPDDLVELVGDLDDHQLGKLARYAEALVDARSRPIADVVREEQDEDRIVSIEEKAGYVAVERIDSEGERPRLYHVTREHYPDGSVDIHWNLVGRVVD